jgi:hypothetical protein
MFFWSSRIVLPKIRDAAVLFNPGPIGTDPVDERVRLDKQVPPALAQPIAYARRHVATRFPDDESTAARYAREGQEIFFSQAISGLLVTRSLPSRIVSRIGLTSFVAH